MVTKGSQHSPNFDFEVGQWYKITITGKPSDATESAKRCEQTILIEGPGLNGYIPGEGYVKDKWRSTNTNDCLDLENYSLKVYVTRDLTYANQTPIDGIVRNVAFTNMDDGTTMQSPCTVPATPNPLTIETTPETPAPESLAPESPTPEPECGCYAIDEEISIENDKCVLNLGSFPDSFPEIWSFSFDLKINYLPPEPTDPRWFYSILEGTDLTMLTITFHLI